MARRRPALIDDVDRIALRVLRAIYSASGLPGGETYERALRALNRGFDDDEPVRRFPGVYDPAGDGESDDDECRPRRRRRCHDDWDDWDDGSEEAF